VGIVQSIHLPLLIGDSGRTRQLLKSVDRVAKGNWPVLILGETGTGKEVVARALHQKCPDVPFVTIDCSSMVGPLMESELFGHVKGTFTGASENRPGLLELAHGGIAFFDEIGDLPLDLQAKLLRATQQREFRPVGGRKVQHSDFRIVAATHRDLPKEVERGRFREDLYHRLNVVQLKIAPLRERAEDIPALVEHFLSLYGAAHTVSSALMEDLLGYDWPGNVRELENCIRGMIAMHTGPELHTGDLPSPITNFHAIRRLKFPEAREVVAPYLPAAPPPPLEAPATRIQRRPPVPETSPIVPLDEVERQHIINAINYTGGDYSLAAHLLGIGRTTLYRKVRSYSDGTLRR